MSRLRASPAFALIAACLAAVPAYASYPDTPRGALKDCGANYPLKGHYTVRVLQTALKDLTGLNAEYSTCADALRLALRQALAPPPKKATAPPPSQKTQRSHTTTTPTRTTTTTTTTRSTTHS